MLLSFFSVRLASSAMSNLLKRGFGHLGSKDNCVQLLKGKRDSYRQTRGARTDYPCSDMVTPPRKPPDIVLDLPYLQVVQKGRALMQSWSSDLNSEARRPPEVAKASLEGNVAGVVSNSVDQHEPQQEPSPGYKVDTAEGPPRVCPEHGQLEMKSHSVELQHREGGLSGAIVFPDVVSFGFVAQRNKRIKKC